MADIVNEIFEHEFALHRMQHFRMELHGVEIFRCIFHGRYGTYRRAGCHLKICWGSSDVIRMTHPANGLGVHTGKQFGRSVLDGNFRLAVFTGRSRIHLAAQFMRHQLGAVANAQNRNPQLKEFFTAGSRIFLIHAVGAAGENNALGCHFPDSVQRHGMRVNLTINVIFTHATGNQLIVLTAEIQHQNHFICRLAQNIVLLFLYLYNAFLRL